MMHARPTATALEELLLEHERWAGTLSGTGLDAREWRSGSEALDWLVRQAQQPPE
jgi:hypothetical protein